jgi:hypothetical protein
MAALDMAMDRKPTGGAWSEDEGSPALAEARERAVARLSEAFALGRIEVEELDRRLTLAHAASTRADVECVLADLGDTAPRAALAPQGENAEHREVVTAVLGCVERTGSWVVPERLHVAAVLGCARLDLRNAVLAPGETVIDVSAVAGCVEIVVPPDMAVEVAGTAMLGGFADANRRSTRATTSRVLRVIGRAVLGGVWVQTRSAAAWGDEARHARAALEPGRCK